MTIEPEFFLDTNICIYLLEGGPTAVKRRFEAQTRGSLAVSTISMAETMVGARQRDAIDRAVALFATLVIAPFDANAADVYASMPFRRGSFDRLIAAQALSLGLTLVTNNEKDFADVPGLRIENWTH